MRRSSSRGDARSRVLKGGGQRSICLIGRKVRLGRDRRGRGATPSKAGLTITLLGGCPSLLGVGLSERVKGYGILGLGFGRERAGARQHFWAI